MNGSLLTEVQGGADADSPPLSAPHGLLSFVATNHSCLALWFAEPGAAPQVLLPCPCCTGNVTKGLSVRHRVFIFAFVVVGIFCATVFVHISNQQPSWIWVYLYSVAVVAPVTCRIKSELPVWTFRLQALSARVAPARMEEIGLSALLVSVVVWAAAKADAVTAGSLVLDFFGTLALALCTEVVSLVWKYLFCAVCCPCCLPAAQSPAPAGATIFV